MPTVSVDRDDLFARLGKTYTDDEFDELCFQFGIELDEVLTEDAAKETRGSNDAVALASAAAGSKRVLYYIAIPANRYDLLCIEGIARALNVFLERIPPPLYRTVTPASPLVMTVKPDTQRIRPYVVCAVLRGVTFTPTRYTSFIDLQDKLHNNICRKRTLVAIGTHDLDTLTAPFVYNALPPADINFVPLSQSTSFRADALMEFYRTNPAVKHIKPYVDIIAGSEVYPVIQDSKGTVLSLPPIINGEHSKISLATRNVFIECTATDLTKAHVVLNTVVTMFSEYCEAPFTVEQVQVQYEQAVLDGSGDKVTGQTTPDLAARVATASCATIASVAGAPIPPEACASLCSRMGLHASLVTGAEAMSAAVAESKASSAITASADTSAGVLRVLVPPTRADVLHECDVVEDVAIAWGYNKIVRTLPKTATTGAQLPVNKLTDHLRRELGMAGYDETLTLALVSREDNYGMMLLPDDGKAVVLANPQSEEFQIGRTAMVPGLLKALQANRGAAVRDGLKLFEISDVMMLDTATDVGARNERHVAALYTGPTAGFEVIHGLVDRVMRLLEVPHRPFAWQQAAQGAGAASAAAGGEAATYGRGGLRYYIEAAACPSYFPGRGAQVVLEKWSAATGTATKAVIGTLGVLHPKVLANFELSYPASVVELNIEPFLDA